MLVDGRTDVIQQEVIDALPALAGISFVEIERAMEKVQNCPGSNPPLMYVLSKLVADGKVKTILEFGSGGTTILFAHLHKKYGLKYVSLENVEEWMCKTEKASLYTGILPEGLFLTERFFDDTGDFSLEAKHALVVKSVSQVDLVFVDSSPGETRTQALHLIGSLRDQDILFHKNTIVMVDDCQELAPESDARGALDGGKVFMSHTRGIYTIDPAHLIDCVIYRDGSR